MTEVFVLSVVFKEDGREEQIIGIYDSDELAKAQSEAFWDKIQKIKESPLFVEEGEDFDVVYEEYLSDKELSESMLCTRIIPYPLNQDLC